jgi:hypothetical protein
VAALKTGLESQLNVFRKRIRKKMFATHNAIDLSGKETVFNTISLSGATMT